MGELGPDRGHGWRDGHPAQLRSDPQRLPSGFLILSGAGALCPSAATPAPLVGEAAPTRTGSPPRPRADRPASQDRAAEADGRASGQGRRARRDHPVDVRRGRGKLVNDGDLESRRGSRHARRSPAMAACRRSVRRRRSDRISRFEHGDGADDLDADLPEGRLEHRPDRRLAVVEVVEPALPVERM